MALKGVDSEVFIACPREQLQYHIPSVWAPWRQVLLAHELPFGDHAFLLFEPHWKFFSTKPARIYRIKISISAHVYLHVHVCIYIYYNIKNVRSKLIRYASVCMTEPQASAHHVVMSLDMVGAVIIYARAKYRYCMYTTIYVSV